MLSKTLSCQFRGRLLVVVTQGSQPRYALRSQAIKLVEHLDGCVELLPNSQALPYRTFERHQHLAASRVADDKMLNARVDDALAKKAARLRRLQARVADGNAQRRQTSSAKA